MVAAGDTRLVVADILRVAACRLRVVGVVGDRLLVERPRRAAGADGDRLLVERLRREVAVVVGEDNLLSAAHPAWARMRLRPVDMVLRRDNLPWA
jgi:hypothetical protein